MNEFALLEEKPFQFVEFDDILQNLATTTTTEGNKKEKKKQGNVADRSVVRRTAQEKRDEVKKRERNRTRALAR